VIYQAEKAKLGSCRVRTKHSGYTGTGYVDYNGEGSFVEWKIGVPKTGDYEVSVRYSSRKARPVDLILDGISKVGVCQCRKTRTWSDWKTESMKLHLTKGSHTLKLEATNSAGPNVDWLSVDTVESKSSKKKKPSPTTTPTRGPVPPPPTANPTRAPVSPRPTPKPTTPVQAPSTAQPTKAPISPWPTAKRTTAPVQSPPTAKPTRVPVSLKPTANPTKAPVLPPPEPSMKPSLPPVTDGIKKLAIVLGPNESLSKREWYWSPSGEYLVGLDRNGNLVMKNKNQRTLWSAGVTDGFRCFMQEDGNLILRDIDHKTIWSSNTSNNHGAKFAISDVGRVLVIHEDDVLWMDGIPTGTYKGPSSQDLSYPIRAIFYYPWYPETWTVQGEIAKFEPDLGFYSSSDRRVVQAHIDALNYAHIDLSIASWWGQGTNDKSRITLLMDETVAMESRNKWTIYFEDEIRNDPSAEVIRDDLDYIKKWFAWHPTWAHMDGRPVVFVYNEAGCEVADRWAEASNGDWYVVLKVFKGFRECQSQPDSWHQYGPGRPVNRVAGISTSISPGFWRADVQDPRLPRVSQEDFCENVKEMVASRDPWQLITTFNEAGEGTMIEASAEWASDTIYGFYLDCLHLHH
jgi:hypothetical protein